MFFNFECICVLGFKINVFDYFVVLDFYIFVFVVEGLVNIFLEVLFVGLFCLVLNIFLYREVLFGLEEFIGLDFEIDDGDDF